MKSGDQIEIRWAQGRSTRLKMGPISATDEDRPVQRRKISLEVGLSVLSCQGMHLELIQHGSSTPGLVAADRGSMSVDLK